MKRARPGVVSESFRRLNISNNNGDNEFQPGLPPEICRKRSSAQFHEQLLAGSSDGESYLSQESEIDSLIRNQQNLRDNKRHSLFLNADYTWPITPKSTLEAGLRSRSELERQYQCILQR
jgi:hypothetical protein